MYGFKYVGTIDNKNVPALTRKFPITASEVITKGDALTLTSGKLDSGTQVSTAKIIGIANENVTGNSGGTNFCEVIVARPGDLYIADNDNVGTTFAATHVGTYFDVLSAATGAQQIDTSSTGTTGQFLCIEYNPQQYNGGIYDSDTSIGLFTPAETYFDGRTA